MHNVFVSFRSEDEPFGALLIHQVLSDQLGSDNVFRCSESIPPGADYVRALLAAIHRCDVLLAVIGPRWLSLTDEAGQPRIQDPRDWVRREISIAFAKGKRVIPVLLDGAVLPAPSALPDDVARLSRCQYRQLEHRQFGANMALLLSDLRTLLPDANVAAPIGVARCPKNRAGHRRYRSRP